MKNSIFMRRQTKVIITEGTSVLPEQYLATVLKNVESLGFTFSVSLMNVLRTKSLPEFELFYKQTISDLKLLVGANVQHKPMYPNFPKEVMEMEAVELYIDAIVHSLGAFVSDVTGTNVTELSLPKTEKEERFPLVGNGKLKVIELGTDEEFKSMIANLIGAKTSISQTDKNDIEWVLFNHENVTPFLPETIAMKENLAFVVGLLLRFKKASPGEVSRYFKTATDVLRLATALSEGDVSLATNTRFVKFKRTERRFFLALLESCNAITEDMLRNKDRWIRLGEILHPAEYKNRYPKTFEAFDILRNNKQFHTFNGKVELALKHGDIDNATYLLTGRPGEFARRLDHLLRLAGANGLMVLSRFQEVVGEVSTPVLLQAIAHFKNRNDNKELRIVFPKGDVANVTGLENKLPAIDADYCKLVVKMAESALVDRFSELPSLGKVVIDERLKNYIVPFSQRSASKALRTIVRGSRLPMSEGDTIRFFLWWKEGKMGNGEHSGRVDIDLSAAMFDADWNYKEHVSYTRLRSSEYNAYHSGDIQSAPNGASEFIDLDIPSVLRNGGRYIVMNIYSFTSQAFSDLPECFAGWMMRNEPNSGEIYEPTTVENRFDVSANTRVSVPVILDLEQREVIWADLGLSRELDYYGGNNIESNRGTVTLMGKAMTNLVKPNLYDLFRLHAEARGEMDFELEEGEEVATIFSVDEGVTPFDIEAIMAEYLV